MSKNSTPEKWIDPDQAPPLTKEWFEEADFYHGEKLIRRGRPKSDASKRAVSLRLDPDVIEWFRATGDGWQTRMNEALRKAAGI